MIDGNSYNKEEIIDALNVSHITAEERTEFVDLVKQANCESFDYLTPAISEMKITLIPTKRVGEKRRIVCGDVVEKILNKLGIKIAPKFPSSIYISELNENREGKNRK